ncbi:hypothetical protein NQ318_004946 [Aromia moschata]|uniref:Uncharacterized protein n=1 Tax=Aromia moschata TaxID=1265417 RepID=A0AAV8XIH5_9CUCU|nr:hypothetical protein NQ318_004946 [Aromia moschata]
MVPIRWMSMVPIRWMSSPLHSIGPAMVSLDYFPGRWIGRGRDCPRPWSVRSPDMTPLDFFVWRTMKEKVYAEPVNDEAALQERIIQAAREMTLAECRAAAQSVVRRCKLCIEYGGSHFEQFL